jgi:hypothetical protein
MKINCLSCGHSIELDEAYSDYEGQIKCFVKCYACSALLEVKLEGDLIKSVKFLKLARSAAGGIITKRHSLPATLSFPRVRESGD